MFGGFGLHPSFLRLAIDLRLFGTTIGLLGVAQALRKSLGVAERTWGWPLRATTAWHRSPCVGAPVGDVAIVYTIT